MIIDSHVHVGATIGRPTPTSMVLESMEKYGVDISLVSCLAGVEVDFDQNPMPADKVVSQYENNQMAIEFARQNPGKIKVLLWAKPFTESCDEQFEQQIIDNRDIVCGIKLHPYHTKTRFDSEKVRPYIELAKKYDLTVMSHTANDECSDIDQVFEMAKLYPTVRFVMAHAGLGTDNSRAIWILKQGFGNLYVDTAWVRPDKAVKMIRECGEDKVLFGSDNPIDGVDTYAHKEFYDIYLNGLKEELTESEYYNLMAGNAIKVYKLDV